MLNVNTKTISINVIINNQNEEPIKKSFMLEIDDSLTTTDLIRLSIERFNEILQEEKQIVSLDGDMRHYSLRPSKKNGSPKLDFPGNVLNLLKFMLSICFI